MEPEPALNGQSRAGIEKTVFCYAQAQIDEMGLRRKWNCLAQGFMVAVPGKGRAAKKGKDGEGCGDPGRKIG